MKTAVFTAEPLAMLDDGTPDPADPSLDWMSKQARRGRVLYVGSNLGEAKDRFDAFRARFPKWTYRDQTLVADAVDDGPVVFAWPERLTENWMNTMKISGLAFHPNVPRALVDRLTLRLKKR